MTIDVIVGLFAGLALIIGVWLLGSVVSADSAHIASALAGWASEGLVRREFRSRRNARHFRNQIKSLVG